MLKAGSQTIPTTLCHGQNSESMGSLKDCSCTPEEALGDQTCYLGVKGQLLAT